MENNYIDKLAKDALGNLEVPYKHADWEAMDQRLDEDAKLRKRLYTMKGIEMVLMLFAFWTITQFLQMNNFSSSDSSTPAIEQQQELPSNQNSIPVPTEEIQEKEAIPKETIPDEGRDAVPYAVLERQSKPKPKISTTNNIQTKQSITNESPIAANLHSTSTLNQSLNSTERTTTHSTLNYLDSKLVSSVASNLNFKKLRKRKIKTNKAKPFKVGFIGFANKNSISTPDFVTATKNPNQLGHTFGVSINRILNSRFEIETGLSYSSMKYAETTVDPFTVGSLLTAKEVQLDFVEIPVNIQANILGQTNDRWRVYAVGGFTNKFNLRSNTRKLNTYQGAPVANPDPRTPEALDRGLLQGGTVNDTYLLTANMGLGFEHITNNKWSFFLQPEYQKGLTKIGRHEDKISTLAFKAGTRMRL